MRVDRDFRRARGNVSWFGDTTGVRGGKADSGQRKAVSAIRCGGRVLRTYRRVCPAASELRNIYEGSGNGLGGPACARSFRYFLSDIPRGGNQRYPITGGCYEFELKVPPPAPCL